MTKALTVSLTLLMLAAQVRTANAQLGTSNNPPPQRLFDTGPSQQLDNGLGTMAERRAKLAKLRRAPRPAHR